MFKSGKKIALSNLPARYVFKILQEAKKTPIIEPEIKFLGTILFSPLLSIFTSNYYFLISISLF